MLPPSLNRHLLFYSRNCQDCSDIICTIRKNATRSSYMFICVDDGHDIPSCVDRVPSIITCRDGDILKGADVVTNFITNSSVQSVEPCSASSDLLRGAKGDSFTFLDDQVCDDGYSCYLPISMMDQFGQEGKMTMPGTMNMMGMDGIKPQSVSNGSDKILEGFIQQRERDDNEFRNSVKYNV